MIKEIIKKNFFAGLIIILPITLAIIVFLWLVTLLAEPFLSLSEHILAKLDAELAHQAFVLLWLGRLLACFFLLLLPILIGWVASKSSSAYFFFKLDCLFLRVPGLRSIYRFSLDIVKATLGAKASPFTKACLFPFPQKDSYVLGLVAGPVPEGFRSSGIEISFFIPTAPYPLSNLLLFTSNKEILALDASTEDIFQFVISGGILPLKGSSKSS
jgi:uncharacterized membrane protein